MKENYRLTDKVNRALMEIKNHAVDEILVHKLYDFFKDCASKDNQAFISLSFSSDIEQLFEYFDLNKRVKAESKIPIGALRQQYESIALRTRSFYMSTLSDSQASFGESEKVDNGVHNLSDLAQALDFLVSNKNSNFIEIHNPINASSETILLDIRTNHELAIKVIEQAMTTKVFRKKEICLSGTLPVTIFILPSGRLQREQVDQRLCFHGTFC